MVTAPEALPRAPLVSRNQPAQPSTQQMPETALQSTYQSLMEERDQILARMRIPAKAEEHVSIAVFEAWADGKIAEPRVKEQMEKLHGRTGSCKVCEENLEYYRARRTDISSSMIQP